MKRLALFLIGFGLFVICRQKAEAFSIHCLRTGSNSGVTVTWDRNGLNPADFRCFYIYHSTSPSGPFSAVDSVFFYTDTSRTHNAANAANNPAYYFIVFKSSTGGPDVYSDTLRAIQLNVVNPGNGFANLAWNAIHDPLLPGNSPYYKIYREFPPGFFTLLDSVDARTAPRPMTYSDQISICNDTIKYRIEVIDNSGCSSVSNIGGDLFRDLQPPPSPLLDTVSLDLNGNAVISWFPGVAADTRNYEILHNVGGIWTPIGNVQGINNTVFYSNVSGNNASQSFTVVAIDSCGNRSAQSLPHNSIYLNANFQICSQAVSLSWSPYTYIGNVTYQIWVSVNGAAESLAGTSMQTNFIHQGLISGSTYCYRIRAVAGTGSRSASSNRDCVVPVFQAPPVFSYLNKVSVLNETQIRVEAYVDVAASVYYFELWRAEAAAGPFVSVGSQLNALNPFISFTDNVSSTASTIYYYKIASIDSCGINVLESQVSRSILLGGEANIDRSNYLVWNSYADWLGQVDHYNIYRRVNGIWSTQPIAVLSGSNPTAFQDIVYNDFYSNGEFCYQVEAIEGPGNPFFFLDSARSNVICLKQLPQTFIPNAFRPGGGLNDIFYPVNGFVNPEGYSFEIFNRWGELVFSTNNPRIGWDGSSNGKAAPEAVYIYRIVTRSPSDEETEKVGSVTLIR